MVLRQSGWGSLSLGLLVEGQSDRDTIPILARRLGYSRRIRSRVVSRGEMIAPDSISRYLTKFLRETRAVTQIIICIDAERENPDLMLASTRPTQRHLNELLPVQVNYSVVDHTLEGWLACDEEAIQSVLGPRARVNIRGNPEEHPNPADLLKQVFRDNGRQFQKTRHDPLIAQHASSERIAARSPTFRRFSEILGHPISG